jgi:opacity protein-like surface antigen
MKFIAAITALALSAGAASAGDWYATGFGGMNWKQPYTSNGEGNSDLGIDADAGYVAGAAVGRKLDDIGLPGFRTEVELSFRSNNINGWFDGPCVDKDLSGHDSTFAAMVNAAYDFPTVWTLRPYVMAGAGYSSRRISIDPTPTSWGTDGFGTERQGFAWQVGAGVNHDVSETVTIGLGYRYFESVAINREVGYWKDSAFMVADGDNHALVAEMTIKLN